ncbi:MAG: hypothetical protein ACTTKF_08650 [Bacteroides sp.]
MNRRKFYTGYGLLSAVLMVLLMFSFSPAAAKKYELYIAGIQVTDDNCNDLSKIEGVAVTEEGWFRYDPAKKMLLMKEVVVQMNSGYPIRNKGIDGLRIKVQDFNRLSSQSTALYLEAATEIEGNGSLTTISNTYAASVYIYKTTLTISKTTLKATGKWGITGEDASKETLIIGNATVSFPVLG